MNLFAPLSVVVVLISLLSNVSFAEEEKKTAVKKLQIGVKKRVENCDQRSRRGDVLSMHYTVSFTGFDKCINSEYIQFILLDLIKN